MSAGLITAVADLDDVAFSQHGGTNVEEFWRRAGIAHSALVRGWFEAGHDAVIAHGPFFESRSYESLFATCPPDGVVTHVLLQVSFAVALTRVTNDGDRTPGAPSTRADFLQSAHDAFHEIETQLPPVDIAIDTSDVTADWVADSIARRLLPTV